jgi:type 1 glutamine amidotransferase
MAMSAMRLTNADTFASETAFRFLINNNWIHSANRQISDSISVKKGMIQWNFGEHNFIYKSTSFFLP